MQTPVNPFKKALKKGQQQYGFWLGLCNPLSAELCGFTGYDWLLIDAEHGPNSISTVTSQLQAIASTPSHAVVRLLDDNPAAIKQTLDAGAQSLLIPMVETAEQASNIVKAVTYPPDGIRGVGTALARAARWNVSTDYFQCAREEICLIIQIESINAVNNLDDILKVKGIDAVFIGPADLASTMGHLGNPNHPNVKNKVKEAISKIKAADLPSGTLAVNPDIAEQYEKAGMQFIALGADTLTLVNGARDILSKYLKRNAPIKVEY